MALPGRFKLEVLPVCSKRRTLSPELFQLPTLATVNWLLLLSPSTNTPITVQL